MLKTGRRGWENKQEGKSSKKQDCISWKNIPRISFVPNSVSFTRRPASAFSEMIFLKRKFDKNDEENSKRRRSSEKRDVR